MSNLVVCSFYTDDDYYRAQAATLKSDLDRLGVEYVVDEIPKRPGQDWADICRQKVPFISSVCSRFPDRRVFWIDVDCRLLSLPGFIRDSSADIIGFQRGFSSPLRIGYANRTRFWEPCFWGVSPSPAARKMVRDAAVLESTSTLKATDDYFFEDAWRINADSLSFQIVPSVCVIGRGDPTVRRDEFFVFGSSGNVNGFKGKVVQHESTEAPTARHRFVARGKRTLARVPEPAARHIVGLADRFGVTALLVPQDKPSPTRARSHLSNRILRAGFDGNTELLEFNSVELAKLGVPSPEEKASVEAAKSFAAYSARPSSESVKLSWWARPFPGNFGDWLSPLIVGSLTDARITYQSPTLPAREPHLMAVGSIGRFIKPSSLVVGTGISSNDVELNPKATYISVRGPLTAQLVRQCGGPVVESLGDPAAILSRLIPLERGQTNGRVAFIRHVRHSKVPLVLPENFDELSVYMSSPAAILDFVRKLMAYDRVVTSAMHVLITCQSYGVPCSLVTFQGFEDRVHGSGIKYEDYSRGVGLDPISPVSVPLDLLGYSFSNIERDDRIADGKKDEIEAAMRTALSHLENRR